LDPAFAGVFTVTLTDAVSSGHGAVPATV
jgi:hypothetical protein